MQLPKIVEAHRRQISQWYYDAQGVLIVIYKRTERRRKTVTAKPSGSARHLGRTNCWGVRV